MSELDENLQARLRIMQMIAGAMIAGVAIFLGIVLFMVHVQKKDEGLARPGGLPVISWVAVALLAVNAPLAFFLPSSRIQSALRRLAASAGRPGQPSPPQKAADVSALLTIKQTSMITALAMLEGVAFLGCIAYLLEAQPFALGVVVLALLLMLSIFPTGSRLGDWLQRHSHALSEMRQQGGTDDW